MIRDLDKANSIRFFQLNNKDVGVIIIARWEVPWESIGSNPAVSSVHACKLP